METDLKETALPSQLISKSFGIPEPGEQVETLPALSLHCTTHEPFRHLVTTVFGDTRLSTFAFHPHNFTQLVINRSCVATFMIASEAFD